MITSFAIETDGVWRKGRLAPVRERDPPVYGGDPGRPWASLEGDSYQSFTISTAWFRTAGKLRIRYTIWARGESVAGGRRWTYCGKSDDTYSDQEPAAELSLPASHPELLIAGGGRKGRRSAIDRCNPAILQFKRRVKPLL